MNFVYLYPNLLNNYYHYTQALHKNGVTVLGVGDVPFEELSQACKDSLTDYYLVTDLGNYEQAGIKTPRYHLVDSLQNGLVFVQQVGYPVIVKPDNGVGANATYKFNSEEELRAFYEELADSTYIMEEFVPGTLVAYEGVCNSKREVLFETCLHFSSPVMDMVNDKLDSWYYIQA